MLLSNFRTLLTSRSFLNLRLFGLALGLVLLDRSLSAQTSFGRISGQIADASGAAVADAKVTIENTGTKALRTIESDTNGSYVITQLPIGDYIVKAEREGFTAQSRSGLAIVADARLTVDFKLEVGNVTETVEVKGSAETLNTVSGELARVIDTKQVLNTPLNGRNYSQLLTLIPGAAVTNPDQFSVTTSLSATNANINGNRSDTSNLTVDGAFNLVAGSNGSLMNNVGPDFIQEVKIQTSNFSAEYGRMAGVAFNVVTKNGTNEFHGSAFEFFRNDKLDARNFFSPQKNPLRFNDFGYSLGGPIRKDKLFFFVGEEWKRLRQRTTPTRQTVPSNAQLNGIFAPGSLRGFPSGNISSFVTPTGRSIANVYRLMSQQAAAFNDAAVANNVVLSPNNPLDFREDIVRIDYRLNEKHSFYGRWIQDSNTLTDPFGTFSGSNLPTTPTIRSRPGESFLVAYTWLPSPSIVNEARANASWASQNIPPTGNTWLRSTYGFTYPQLFEGGQYDNGIPNVDINNFANFRGPSFALHSPTTDIQFGDTLTYIRGRHILKGGFVYFRDRVDQNGRPPYTGAFSFNPSGNPNSTGNAFADALLGRFRTYSEASADPLGFFRFSQYEAFVQDSYKVSNRLSLELGLRWQHAGPMYTQANNMSNFIPAAYNPANAVSLNSAGTIIPNSGNRFNGLVAAGNGVPADEAGRVPGAGGPAFGQIPTGAPRGLYSSENNFGPRAGFAFQASSRTVIRGGYGIFYNRPQGNLIFSQVNLPPFLQIAQFENGNAENPGGASGASASVGVLGQINALTPNLRNSYAQQFSFTIQQQLPWSIFFETSYVGNLGRALLRRPDINYPDFGVLNRNPTVPVNTLRPYRGFSAINQYRSDSTSNYHAFQAYASKRAGAVQATASYTWSKVLTDASGQDDNPENYLDRHYSYGPASFDRRHVFTGTFVWALPSLNGRNWLLRGVAGGWQVSGIIRLQTGSYATITGNTSIGTRRANYLGGETLAPEGQRNINNWINRNAFAIATTGAYGSSGVGVVQLPGLQTYDLSAAKNFTFQERYGLRFQADFFNAFNTANFFGLGTTITSGGFGTLSSAYPPRNLQLSLKLTF